MYSTCMYVRIYTYVVFLLEDYRALWGFLAVLDCIRMHNFSKPKGERRVRDTLHVQHVHVDHVDHVDDVDDLHVHVDDVNVSCRYDVNDVHV